jgi:hypothetical protein
MPEVKVVILILRLICNIFAMLGLDRAGFIIHNSLLHEPIEGDARGFANVPRD